MRRFVILAAPRTGSNLLCSLLQSHPSVLCHHELFNPSGIFVALPLRNASFSFGSLAQRDAAPERMLRKVWSKPFDASHVGFKMTRSQHQSIVQSVCEDGEIHKIVLRRNARLRSYVSFLIAERSGVWEDYCSDTQQHIPRPVNVDYIKLKQTLALDEAFYRQLDRLILGPRSDVVYEALLTPAHQHRLLDELGLPRVQLRTKTRQQNPYSLDTLISNLPALVTQLENNPGNQLLLDELAQEGIYCGESKQSASRARQECG